MIRARRTKRVNGLFLKIRGRPTSAPNVVDYNTKCDTFQVQDACLLGIAGIGLAQATSCVAPLDGTARSARTASQ